MNPDRARKMSGDDGRKREQEAALALSNCVFSQYHGVACGILVGLAVSLRTRNYWPTFTAGFAGTVFDLYAGISYNCRDQRAAWEACRRAAVTKPTEA